MFFHLNSFFYRDFLAVYHNLNFFKFKFIECIKVLVSISNVDEIEILYFFLYFEFIFENRPLIYKIDNSRINIVLHFNNVNEIFNFIYRFFFLYKFSRIKGYLDFNNNDSIIYFFQDVSRLPLISVEFISSEVYIDVSFFFKNLFLNYYKSFVNLFN